VGLMVKDNSGSYRIIAGVVFLFFIYLLPGNTLFSRAIW
jgi:hypothetical protein